jgi:hypothetical protein
LSYLKFRPEIWSAKLLVAYRNSLVYEALVNRDYEGEIAEYGDTVRITNIGRPTIWNYTPNQSIPAAEQVNDAQRTLVVDQAKGFNFAVDDIDKRQARGNVVTQSMTEAAYGLANQVDQYISAFYTSIQSANQLGAKTVSSAANATDALSNVLIPMKVRLDKANVPTQGRVAIVSPDFHGALLQDNRFLRANESGTTDSLRNGFVGRAVGFDILLSNQTPTTTGTDSVIIAGTNAAITFAEQLTEIEPYRPQDKFADAVKGLTLYGAKVIRPDSLASAYVTVS